MYAIQFQNLFLTFQILFLIVAGNTSIRQSFATVRFFPNPVRKQTIQVIATLIPGSPDRGYLAFPIPTPKRRNGNS